MMFAIDNSDMDEFAEKMQKAGKMVPGSIEQGMTEVVLMVESTTKKEYLSGPGPKLLMVGEGKTGGRLRSSITHKVRRKGVVVEGVVGTNVEYAPIHELGLTVNKISKKGKSFVAKYPARPFLSTSLKDHTADAERILGQKVFALITYD